MQAWAKLSPDERREARERYQTLRRQPPRQREEVKKAWEEYKKAAEEYEQYRNTPQPTESAKTAD
jgi:hypothetical protein